VAVALAQPTVFFDGVCGFCNREVRWLLHNDRTAVLQFAPLQGPTASSMRIAIPGSISGELETMVLAEPQGDGQPVRFSYRSDAALRILAISGAAPWVLRLLRIVPRPLRELGYALIARYRYRIWGQLDECRIPSEDEKARFLP
jgi:predicted DCC family thiol-disulfide oxidoreductase YuxK